ncbi:MAG TPA: trypsin-like peptidase domain-containing protein [Iamia sp.]
MLPPDDDRPGRPLPPEDRLWRHPSEVARAAAAAAAPALESDSRRRRTLVTVGLMSGLAGAAVTVVSLAAIGAFTTTGSERDLTTPTGPPTTAVRSATAIATSVAPAVVEVTATVGFHTRRGSGVVARSDGLVLTSEQLVSGATTVSVAWPSGRQEVASIEGVDPTTGLAAVTVAGTGYPVATLDMTPPRPGEQAIAVSARSGGEAPTVVEATVNATSTHVEAGDALLVGLIETDHSVPDGADGGALVDGEGNLRGICVVLDVSTGAEQADAGWAVPAEVALRVADDLRRLGRVDRGWLGIRGGPAAVDGAVPAGVAIAEVMPWSPAEQAGLAVGDVILSVDDHRVRSFSDVKAALALTRPGQSVVVEINRADQTALVAVTLAVAQ